MSSISSICSNSQDYQCDQNDQCFCSVSIAMVIVIIAIVMIVIRFFNNIIDILINIIIVMLTIGRN